MKLTNIRFGLHNPLLIHISIKSTLFTCHILLALLTCSTCSSKCISPNICFSNGCKEYFFCYLSIVSCPRQRVLSCLGHVSWKTWSVFSTQITKRLINNYASTQIISWKSRVAINIPFVFKKRKMTIDMKYIFLFLFEVSCS